MRSPLLVVSILGLTAGCALRGDVRKVELQVEALQAEVARADAEFARRFAEVAKRFLEEKYEKDA